MFCLDDRLLQAATPPGRGPSSCSSASLISTESFVRGSGLVIRRGRPEEELVELAGDVDAEAIH